MYLEEGILSGHGVYGPGQCASWDVISTRAIEISKLKQESSGLQNKNSSFFIFPLGCLSNM